MLRPSSLGEFVAMIDRVLHSYFADVYDIVAAILLYHFGAHWLVCDFLFLFGELCEVMASFFFLFVFIGLVIYYRNFLFVIYERNFLKTTIFLNTLVLFFKNTIFFKNIISAVKYLQRQFSKFFNKK